MAMAGGRRYTVPREVLTPPKPLKKKRRPATSCMAYTLGVALIALTRLSSSDGLVPMSRTVVIPCASRSRRSSESSCPALPPVRNKRWTWLSIKPGMSHCPCASRIRAPAGSGHSPAPPAHTIRPARTSVTALVTMGRPVPSHRFALTIARVGFGGGARRGWGGRPPQAPSVNVPRKTAEETTDERNFMRALLAPAATRRTTPRGGVAHLDCFKMRGKDAFGRDRQACSCSDWEHDA